MPSEREIPEIKAEVTFLAAEQGGRQESVDLATGQYCPHVVVGDANRRWAIVRDNNVIDEEYLGVRFKPAVGHIEPGEPQPVVLQLIYYPQVNYGALCRGATFTVREGPRVVAFGRVLEPVKHN